MSSRIETYVDAGIDMPVSFNGRKKMICPKCGHSRRHKTDRSLSVQGAKGVWRCHNCGWKGGLAGSGRSESQRIYVKPSMPAGSEPAYEFATVEHQQFYTWFSGKRGISPETLAKAGVHFCEREILFPYYLKHYELINIKHRTADKKFWMEADAELIFWNLTDWSGWQTVVITEGEIDALSYMEAGINAVISVPNGASVGSMEYFQSGIDLFEQCDRVVLSIDSDEAGVKLEAELARRIGKDKCWRVVYPPDCKDANEVLVKEGPEAIRDLFEKAEPYPIGGIIMPATLKKDYLNLYDFGSDKGLSTGWPIFDMLCTFRPGQTVVVTGTPGSGKSEWVDSLMVQMAKAHNLRCGIYSPEYFPPHRYARKWAQKLLRKPFRDGPNPRMSREEAEYALEWMDKHATIFVPDDPTIDEILELCEIMVKRDAVDILLIDPFNEVVTDIGDNQNKTDWISEVLGEFRRFLHRTDTIGIIIAHPTKLQKIDKLTNRYPVVQPYDISDSANWYNKSDIILSIDRDRTKPATPVNVHVQKMRWEELGQLGVCDFTFDLPTRTYTDIGARFASGNSVSVGHNGELVWAYKQPSL